jgi:hypothetical protein
MSFIQAKTNTLSLPFQDIVFLVVSRWPNCEREETYLLKNGFMIPLFYTWPRISNTLSKPETRKWGTVLSNGMKERETRNTRSPSFTRENIYFAKNYRSRLSQFRLRTKKTVRSQYVLNACRIRSGTQSYNKAYRGLGPFFSQHYNKTLPLFFLLECLSKQFFYI